MPRIMECPKCGEDITYSYQDYDPSVGIMRGGWYCEACDLTIDDEDEDESDIEKYG